MRALAVTHVGVYSAEKVPESLKFAVPPPNLMTFPIGVLTGGKGAEVLRYLHISRRKAMGEGGGGRRREREGEKDAQRCATKLYEINN